MRRCAFAATPEKPGRGENDVPTFCLQIDAGEECGLTREILALEEEVQPVLVSGALVNTSDA